MCDLICVPQDDGTAQYLRWLRDVRPVLGVEPVLHDATLRMPPDCCLCPCDIEATAAAAGYVVARHDDDGCHVLRRAAAS